MVLLSIMHVAKWKKRKNHKIKTVSAWAKSDNWIDIVATYDKNEGVVVYLNGDKL